MKTCLLSLLLLTGLGWAEPQMFEADDPVQGHVLLVAENGEAEAQALARCGFDCGLSHATTVAEVNEDLTWMQHRFPMQSHLTADHSSVKLTCKGNLELIGLGNRAPLAWQTKKPGVICIDPNPDPAHYPTENPCLLYTSPSPRD